jgi:hypothetical protein
MEQQIRAQQVEVQQRMIELEAAKTKKAAEPLRIEEKVIQD